MKVTFVVVDFRMGSIGNHRSGIYKDSDERSQGLQFDWVTITINQSENTKMLESKRIDLVDDIIL